MPVRDDHGVDALDPPPREQLTALLAERLAHVDDNVAPLAAAPLAQHHGGVAAPVLPPVFHARVHCAPARAARHTPWPLRGGVVAAPLVRCALVLWGGVVVVEEEADVAGGLVDLGETGADREGGGGAGAEEVHAQGVVVGARRRLWAAVRVRSHGLSDVKSEMSRVVVPSGSGQHVMWRESPMPGCALVGELSGQEKHEPGPREKVQGRHCAGRGARGVGRSLSRFASPLPGQTDSRRSLLSRSLASFSTPQSS